VKIKERPAKERIKDFDEVVVSYSSKQASDQAQRCISISQCSDCEVCELLCPDLCIRRDMESGDILIDLDHCKGCGLCSFFCPKGAIKMELESS
jgi:Pyruvate/2-oxoacid:ferredoxin oxidoreductase delta subunit